MNIRIDYISMFIPACSRQVRQSVASENQIKALPNIQVDLSLETFSLNSMTQR